MINRFSTLKTSLFDFLKVKSFRAFGLGVVMIGLILIPTSLQAASRAEDGQYLPWEGGGVLKLSKTPSQHYWDLDYWAQDFARPAWVSSVLGMPVRALADGVIVEVEDDYNNGCGWGRYIVIDHGGIKARYNHLQLNAFTKNDVGLRIRRGQEIGALGESGKVTGPNLEIMLYAADAQGPFRCKTSQTIRLEDTGYPMEGFLIEDLNTPMSSWPTSFSHFNYPRGTHFQSLTSVRPDNPDDPWDPPVVDALERYLENYGYMFPSGMIAEPINAATGNFIHRATDLHFGPAGQEKVEALEPALNHDWPLRITDFERFYNSQARRQGSLGQGWSHSYNYFVAAHQNQTYSVNLPDGRGELFEETDADPRSFTPTFISKTPFSTASLERLAADGQYQFLYTSSQGLQYFFHGFKDTTQTPSVTPAYWGKIKRLQAPDGSFLNFTYNSQGDLEKVEDQFGQFIAFRYNTGRFLTKTFDHSGRVVLYIYNYDGRLEQATTSLSTAKSYQYTYDSQGQITTITDPRGITFVSNVYDSAGRVIEQNNAVGGVTTFSYQQPTPGRFITLMTDPVGTVHEYHHDSNLYLIAEGLQGQQLHHYSYDQNGRRLTEKTPLGLRTHYQRDQSGRPLQITHPDGSFEYFTYNTQGQLTSHQTPQGQKNYYYNTLGQLILFQDAMGSRWYAYNDQGLFNLYLDEESRSTTFSYNSQGQLTTQTSPDSESYLTYIYDQAGFIQSLQDPLGVVINFDHNAWGRLTSLQDSQGTTHYHYDANGNLVTLVDALKGQTTWQTDGEENITAIIHPDGFKQEFSYDLASRKLQAVTVDGLVLRYEYDQQGRKTATFVQTDQGFKTQTTYQYDLDSRLVTQTDALGGATHFTYDGRGNLRSQTDPLGASTQYQYNFLGQLTKITGPLGATTSFDYDSRGNQTSQTDPLGTEIHKTYSPTSKLIKQEITILGQTKPLQTITYQYNQLGQVSQQKIGALETSFDYDLTGRLTKRQDPDGLEWQFTYDQAGNLTQTTQKTADNQRLLHSQTTYDALGQPVSQTNALGATTHYQYDLRGRLKQQTNPVGQNTFYDYDSLGRLQEIIDPTQAATRYTYDALGQLTKTTDALGNSTTHEYDALGRLIKTIDALGNSTTHEYDALGGLIKTTDTLGSFTTYEYDTVGRLTKTTDALGNTTIYEYDLLGRLTSQRDPLGGQINYQYDGLDRLIKKQDSGKPPVFYSYNQAGYLQASQTFVLDPYQTPQRKLTYYQRDRAGRLLISASGPSLFELQTTHKNTYDSFGRLEASYNALGQKQTSYQYDALGQVTTLQDALGHQTKFSYDALGQTNTITWADGSQERYGYDALGRLTQQTNALGATTSYQYDALGRLTQQTNALGATTSYQYDALGRLTKTLDSLGQPTHFAYDGLGRLTQQTNALGARTRYQYDTLGRLIKQIDPRGATTHFAYDALGQPTQSIDPLGATTYFEYDRHGRLLSQVDDWGEKQFIYDSQNRLIKTLDPRGAATSYSYDNWDNLIQETDALGATTNYHYDLAGQLVKKTNALGKSTHFSYNALGQLIAQTDPQGRVTTYGYDSLGRQTSFRDPLGHITHKSYDALGNVTKETDASGATIHYHYNPVGYLQKITDPLGHTINYHYDKPGNLTQTTNQAGFQTTFTYDALGRLTKEQDPLGAKTSYQYDQADNLIKKTDPLGQATHYQYDLKGRLISQTTPLGAKTTYSYDSQDNLTQQTDPLGSTSTYSYNPLGQLTQVQDSLGATVDYQYDLKGRLTSQTTSLGAQTKFTYDEVGQLISKTNALGNQENFHYNDAGQVIQQIDPLGSTYFHYNDAGYLIQKKRNQEAMSFNYDPVGRLTKASRAGSSLTYQYNTQGLLTSQSDSLGTTSYSYDPRGLLQQKTSPSGLTTDYTYDAAANLTNLKLQQDSSIRSYDFTYDLTRRLIGQSYPNGLQTSYRYDLDGHLQQQSLYQEKLLYQAQYQRNLRGDKTKEIIQGSLEDKGPAYARKFISKELSDKKPQLQVVSQQPAGGLDNHRFARKFFFNPKEDQALQPQLILNYLDPQGDSQTLTLSLKTRSDVINQDGSQADVYWGTEESWIGIGQDAQNSWLGLRFSLSDQELEEIASIQSASLQLYNQHSQQPDQVGFLDCAHDELQLPCQWMAVNVHLYAENTLASKPFSPQKSDLPSNRSRTQSFTQEYASYDGADRWYQIQTTSQSLSGDLAQDLDNILTPQELQLPAQSTYIWQLDVTSAVQELWHTSQSANAPTSPELPEPAITLLIQGVTHTQTTTTFALSDTHDLANQDGGWDEVYKDSDQAWIGSGQHPQESALGLRLYSQEGLPAGSNILQATLELYNHPTNDPQDDCAHDELQLPCQWMAINVDLQAELALEPKEYDSSQPLLLDRPVTETVAQERASYDGDDRWYQNQLKTLDVTSVIQELTSQDKDHRQTISLIARPALQPDSLYHLEKTYQYDALGQLTHFQSWFGHSYSQKLQPTPAPTLYPWQESSYSYDAGYNLIKQTQQNYPENSLETTNYNYNALGQLTSDGMQDYHYDAVGNLSQQGTTSYSYSAWNELQELSEDSLTYDPLHRPSQVNDQKLSYQGLGWQRQSYGSKDLITLNQRLLATSSQNDYQNFITNDQGSLLWSDANHLQKSLPGNYSPWGQPEPLPGATPTPPVADWGYSGQLQLPASQQLLYGSRLYDPHSKRWSQPDHWPGLVSDPQSRHSYLMVNNNPVNLVDQAGFWGVDFNLNPTPAPQIYTPLERLVENSQNQIPRYQQQALMQQASLQTSLNQISGLIPSLQAQVSQTRYAAYQAKMDYNDYTVMQGITGRLQARGYDWDYDAVAEHMHTQVQATGHQYRQRQAELSQAQSALGGALNQQHQLQRSLQQLGKAIQSLDQLISTNQTIANQLERGVRNDILGRIIDFGQSRLEIGQRNLGDIDQEILDLESSGSTLETVDSAVMAMQTVCGIALAEPTLGGEIGCGLASGMRGLTKLAILAQGVTTAQLIEDYRLDYEETLSLVEGLESTLELLRAEVGEEVTPSSDPDKFESIKGSKAKRNKETGEIWEKDLLHKDHYEVYKNKNYWEKSQRNRSVWDDGRIKDIF